ncbi:hypothetical protein CCR75_001649 [Bremia lactucae]|uniref:Protein kinase domain-containing protein n=1 Tax=Bremia lactucae TaxID=4779 RepID=A0A976FPF5_BRELC|nr:hypothetical protein CCR75_001649 [Bremia lactucae]
MSGRWGWKGMFVVFLTLQVTNAALTVTRTPVENSSTEPESLAALKAQRQECLKSPPQQVTLMQSRSLPDAAYVIYKDCAILTIRATTLSDGSVSMDASRQKIEVVRSFPNVDLLYEYLQIVPIFYTKRMTKLHENRNLSGNWIQMIQKVDKASVMTFLSNSHEFTAFVCRKGIYRITGSTRLVTFHSLVVCAFCKNLDSNQLTGIFKDNVPDTVTSISIRNNSLKSLQSFQLSDETQFIDISGNAIVKLSSWKMPPRLQSFRCQNCGIKLIGGVVFPTTKSLSVFDLSGSNVELFEITHSSLAVLNEVQDLVVTTVGVSCKDRYATWKIARSMNLCVLPDTYFGIKYLINGTDVSKRADPFVSKNDTHSTRLSNWMMLAVTCLGAMFVCILGGVVFFIFRRRQLDRDVELEEAETLAYNPESLSAFKVPQYLPRHVSGTSQTGQTDSIPEAGLSPSGASYVLHDIRMNDDILQCRLLQKEVVRGDLLAKGGYGAVYLATFQNDLVVVKQLLPERARNKRCLGNFLDEIRLCSTLDHPKIVHFIGVTWSSLLDICMVLEYVPHGDLSTMLQQQLDREEENDVARENGKIQTSNTRIAVLVSAGALRPNVHGDCPRSVRKLVDKCLAFHPEDRPSALQIHFELRNLELQREERCTSARHYLKSLSCFESGPRLCRNAVTQTPRNTKTHSTTSYLNVCSSLEIEAERHAIMRRSLRRHVGHMALFVLLLERSVRAQVLLTDACEKPAPTLATLRRSETIPSNAEVVYENCTVVQITSTSSNGSTAVDASNLGIAVISSFPDVTTVILSGNQVTTIYEDSDATVKMLDLSANGLSALDALSIPSSVNKLILDKNAIKNLDQGEIPDTVTTLSLQRNNISTLTIFSFSDTLESLDTSGNPICDLSKWQMPSQLQMFSCLDCNVRRLSGMTLPSSGSLAYVNLEGSTVESYEIANSTLPLLTGLTRLKVAISSRNCPIDAKATIYPIQSVNVCVLPDAIYNRKYVIASDFDTSTSVSSTNYLTATSGWMLVAVIAGAILVLVLLGGVFAYVLFRHRRWNDSMKQYTNETRSDFQSVVEYRTTLKPSTHAYFERTLDTRNIPYEEPAELESDTRVCSKRQGFGSTLASSTQSIATVAAVVPLKNDIRTDLDMRHFQLLHKDVVRGKLIATGGYGAVYKATFRDRIVVTKQILPDRVRDPHMLNSFMDEIRTCASLDHPKIVTFLGFTFTSLLDLSAVFEYMPHGDLATFLQKQLKRETRDPATLVHQCLDADPENRPSALQLHYELRNLELSVEDLAASGRLYHPVSLVPQGSQRSFQRSTVRKESRKSSKSQLVLIEDVDIALLSSVRQDHVQYYVSKHVIMIIPIFALCRDKVMT